MEEKYYSFKSRRRKISCFCLHIMKDSTKLSQLVIFNPFQYGTASYFLSMIHKYMKKHKKNHFLYQLMIRLCSRAFYLVLQIFILAISYCQYIREQLQGVSSLVQTIILSIYSYKQLFRKETYQIQLKSVYSQKGLLLNDKYYSKGNLFLQIEHQLKLKALKTKFYINSCLSLNRTLYCLQFYLWQIYAEGSLQLMKRGLHKKILSRPYTFGPNSF